MLIGIFLNMNKFKENVSRFCIMNIIVSAYILQENSISDKKGK